MESATAGPAGVGGSAAAQKSLDASLDESAARIEKTQFRRRGVGPGVRRGGGVAFAPGRRRGLSTGAAVGIGVGAAALGILGAAAAANAAAPAPVYGGGCYITRQPMYDNWGNYIGRRRVRVCD